MKTHIETYWTGDIDLVAALRQLGFRLKADMPATRIIREDGQHSDRFYFQASADTEYGRLEAAKVARVWAEPDSRYAAEFAEKHPEAFRAIEAMRGQAINRKFLLEAVRTKVKTMTHHRVNGYDCYLPLDASESLRNRMKHMIEGEAV